jgi:hypothetical protein
MGVCVWPQGDDGTRRQRDEVYRAAENLLGGEVMTLVRKIRTLQVGVCGGTRECLGSSGSETVSCLLICLTLPASLPSPAPAGSLTHPGSSPPTLPDTPAVPHPHPPTHARTLPSCSARAARWTPSWWCPRPASTCPPSGTGTWRPDLRAAASAPDSCRHGFLSPVASQPAHHQLAARASAIINLLLAQACPSAPPPTIVRRIMEVSEGDTDLRHSIWDFVSHYTGGWGGAGARGVTARRGHSQGHDSCPGWNSMAGRRGQCAASWEPAQWS